LIYDATNGYLKEVAVDHVKNYELGLYAFLEEKYASLLEQIRTTGELSKLSEETLNNALKEYTDGFLNK
jgi:F-type H+-transporting ATPase subunit alpha